MYRLKKVEKLYTEKMGALCSVASADERGLSGNLLKRRSYFDAGFREKE